MGYINHYTKSIMQHRAAALILLLFIILAVSYSLVTPPFEAGDESRHYAVVKYMADTGRLPVQQPGEPQIHWSHEGNQPPLYYALAALLTGWIDTGAWDEVFWYNPHTTIGNPLRPNNKNITIHPPGAGWPWQGHVLAVHLIRFTSIAMAAVTVAAGYSIALALFKGRRWPAAGAMALTAFNPMFIFIAASVNNDNLVIMLTTLALLLMVRMSEQAGQQPAVNSQRSAASDQRSAVSSQQSTGQSSNPPSPSSIALLGLFIGLGALSKLYALGLLPLAGLLLVWLAYRTGRRPSNQPQASERDIPGRGFTFQASVQRSTLHLSRFARRLLAWNLLLTLVVLAVAGWFYWRNAVLYDGDLLALQVMRDTAGQRTKTPTLATLWAEFEGFRIAYWALFGGVNILASVWIYRIIDVLSLFAALGVISFIIAMVLQITRGKSRRAGPTQPRPALEKSATAPNRRFRRSDQVSLPTFYLLLGWYFIMMAGFIIWNLTQPAGQGRLLYPAITAISALGTLGLTWWLPGRWQQGVIGLSVLGLFAFAALSPILYIAPAYAKAPLLSEADLPADLQPVDLTYDGTIRLIGYRLPQPTVRPAESLPITLYWQLAAPADLDYSIFVHLLGRQRQPAGQIDTYPGNGAWPTSLLSPGDIVADRYLVPVRPETEYTQAPTQLLIAAGVYDLNEPDRPGRPAVNAAGETVEPIIGRARLIPWQWPDPPRMATPVEFHGPAGQVIITLLSYQVADDQTALTLNWQANSDIDRDYTVFIQAWPPGAQAGQGSYTAGFDGPPRQGDYPTSLWRAGDVVVDTHPLALSALPGGAYELLVGLYDPITGERLPAFAAGRPLENFAVRAGLLEAPE